MSSVGLQSDLGSFFQHDFFLAIIAVTAIGGLVAYLVYFNKWAQRRLWEARNRRRIKKMKDHFIVVGFGRIGQKIVDELQAEDVPIIVIDKQDYRALAHAKKFAWLRGNPAEDENILKEAGIHEAKALIISVGTDADAVFIAVTARALRDDLLMIARASSPEVADKLAKIGVQKVALPHVIGGYHMAAMALRPSVVDFLDIVVDTKRPDIVVEDVEVAAHSSLDGKQISDELSRREKGLAILAIRRKAGGTVTNPTGDVVIQSGDHLIVMGTRTQIHQFQKDYGVKEVE